MMKEEKTKTNNQWAGSNVDLTGKSGESKKTATNNQWTSANKKSQY